MRDRVILSAALLATAWAGARASAQSTADFFPVSAFTLPTAASSMLALGEGGKSPVLAAVLNGLFLPGAGNFYAGNPAHGFRHVGLHFAGAYLVFSNVSDDPEGPLFEEDQELLFVSGLALLTANLVWSVFTGIEDAKAATPRPRGEVATVLAPRLVPLGSAGGAERGPNGGTPRMGLQLLRISF
jgi:hypothetical protein